MSKVVENPPPGFDDLSVEEQIGYVQALWDRIAANPEHVPVPEWHQRILEERLKALEENPEDSVTWEEFESRIRKSASPRGR